jgi:hypothetical protein
MVPTGPYNNSNVSPYGIYVVPKVSQQAYDELVINSNDELFWQDLWADNQYNFETPSSYPMPISDSSGIPGQSNSNPLSNFGSHYFPATNYAVYNPSYGVEYSGGPNDVTQNLTFLGQIGSLMFSEQDYDYDWNHDGDKDDIVDKLVLILDPNISNYNLDIVYSTYD